MIDEAARRIVEYIDGLPAAKSDLRDPAEFARSVREAMPESGEPYEKILDHLFDDVIPRSFLTAGPGYLAYIPGGGLPAAAIADLIADATNR